MLIKFCGIQPDSVLPELAPPSAITLSFGINAIATSRRFVPASERAPLIKQLKTRWPQAKIVAVTAQPSEAEANRLVQQGFDGIQLHGDETIADMRKALAIFANRWVVKALSPAQLSQAPAWSSVANWILIDSVTGTGGTGQAFDWRRLRALTLPPVWVLAGGLTAESIPAAWQQVADLAGFAGMDVASGICAKDQRSAQPVRIDPERVRQFYAAFIHSCMTNQNLLDLKNTK